MKNLEIDIETFSSADLAKCGVYKYAEAPDFVILLFGYSVDGGGVKVIDLASGEKLTEEILTALTDEDVTKWAFNAQFERICISRFLRLPTGEYLDPKQWRCSMVWSAYLGLPLSLEGVGAVLGLEKQKLSAGKELIRYFCIPCRPTKANGGRNRNLPMHAAEKWELFKSYNIRDVEAEMQIQEKLRRFPVPEEVWAEYHLDQMINDRGIMVDRPLVEQAFALDEISKAKLMKELQEQTGLENPNSVVQMKGWLAEHGVKAETLGKKAVAGMLRETAGDIKEVLSLRLQLAKSSVKKYQAMQNAACLDNRCRGMFMFYGANRTGRFAGRLVQLQNLPQNHIEDLAEARALVRMGDYDALDILYEDIPDTLSQLIRTAFIPEAGKRFIVADFSAIEARVIAWMAGEKWRMQLFADGGDIYCQSASKMFGVPVVKHGVNGHLRQKGKIAELACIAEGSLVLTNHGLKPIEEVCITDRLWDGENWVKHEGVIFKGEREVISYDGLTATPDHLVWVKGQPQPVQFGVAASSGAHLIQTGMPQELVLNKRTARVYDIRNAGKHHRFTVSGRLVHNCGYGGGVGALKAMGASDMGLSDEELTDLVAAWRSANPHIVRFWWAVDGAIKKAVKEKSVQYCYGLSFTCRSGMLFIRLPSGRVLSYVKPCMGKNKFGGESVTYEGVGATKKWDRLESYGPKFVENIVQAASRDLLLHAMQNLKDYRIVAHVHDEVIIEAEDNQKLATVCELMARVPAWADGLILRADGYSCDFYKKD